MKRREKALKRILTSDLIRSVSASLCAPHARRMVKATSGTHWLNSVRVREISTTVTAFFLEDAPRLRNDAFAKIIILIQIMDTDLTCIICGGRMVLRGLLLVHRVSGYLPFSLISSLINFRRISYEINKIIIGTDGILAIVTT